MAKTPSTMVPLGTSAPDFHLPEPLTGKQVKLHDVKSDIATVILFICNHCPFVKHIQHQLVNVADAYQKKGVTFVAINANDIANYPDDSPENMAELARTLFNFPYLDDASQATARAYDAACTPDFFVYDKELKLAYRGRFDASTPGNQIPVTGEDLTQALEALIQGKPVSPTQQPSIGCNIKWKS